MSRRGYEGITDFIFMEDQVEKADVILIAGGSKQELMEKAADLYHQGYSKYILPSGGPNKNLLDYESEFDFLKAVGLSLGVNETAFIKEDKARHTFDNGALSRAALRELELPVKKAILVCKGFHSRRAYMTYKLHFPDTKIMVQTIVDDNNITRDNWMYDPKKRERVLGEVVKIGKYFEDHMNVMISRKVK